MSSFISLFKEMYYKNEKKGDEISNESIHNILISLLKKNSTDNIDNNELFAEDLYENNIKLIAHGLMSQTINEEEEKSKMPLLRKLLDGKGININNLANKYRNFLDKEIILLRKKIVSLIKNKPNINDINFGKENSFDEISFYNYLSQGKDLIVNFLSKYKIKNRFKFNSELFNDIFEN